MESNNNYSRPKYRRDVRALQECIHIRLATLSAFYSIRNKSGYTDDNKLAEYLFSDLFSLVLDKKYLVAKKSNQEGYDIYSSDGEHAIQISSKVDAEKVYKSLTGTLECSVEAPFNRISILVLKDTKPNIRDLTIKSKFEKDKRCEDYDKLEFRVKDDLLDLGWVGKESINDTNKLEEVIEILNSYLNYYKEDNPETFEPNDKENIDHHEESSLNNNQEPQGRKSIIKELNSTTSSWVEYFSKLQEAFSPLNVLPLSVLNNIKRNDKTLFVSRHRGKYYVKDDQFIKEIKDNSFEGNTLNSTLISYGITSIRKSRTNETIQITSKSKATCPICSLYSFNLPLGYTQEGYVSEEDPIKSAYVNYLLGHSENAIRDLEVKSDESSMEGYLSLLGLRRMRRVDYKLSEEDGIYELPASEKLEQILEHPDLYEEQITTLRYLKDRDYWDRQYSMIENISKVENKTRLFTLEQQNQLHETLISTWEDVYKVIRIASHNYLIYDLEYTNIAQLCKAVVSMVLRIADKYDLMDVININLDNLRNFIFHIQPGDLNTLINKHNHSIIFKSSDFITSFKNQTKNLERLLGSLPEERYNAPIWKYIVNYLSNALLLSEFCENSSPVFNNLLDLILDIVSEDKMLGERLEDELSNFIESRSEEIGTVQIERAQAIYPESATIKKILNRLKDFKDDITKMPLIVFEKKRSQLTQDEVTLYLDSVKEKLQNNFSIRFFRNAVVTDCVKYEDFQAEALDSLAKSFRKYQKREMFTSDAAKYDIIFLIDAMYTGNHFLSPSQIESLNIEEDYFRWVLNPNKWDYKEFNVYFISRFHSDVIRKRIVNIPEVKRILEDFLRSSNDEHLSRIYFNFCL